MKNIIVLFSLFLMACVDKQEGITLETQSNKIDTKTDQKKNEVPEIKPGVYVEYHPNGGVKMQGLYNDDLTRQGLWVAYYADGTKWSESYYTNGLKDGHSLTFYPNGKIRYIAEYKLDQKVGTWTFYDENGNISKEEKY